MMLQLLAQDADDWGTSGSGMMGWGHMGGWGPGSMMNWGNSSFGWTAIILSWVTWILVIVALIAAIRWLWKKGSK